MNRVVKCEKHFVMTKAMDKNARLGRQVDVLSAFVVLWEQQRLEGLRTYGW